MSTTIGRRSAVIVLVAVLAAAVGITSRTILTRVSADAFLRQATSLPLHVATMTQVQAVVMRYGGHPESSACSSKECEYFFSFDNDWLYRLHLAPHARLTCTLGVYDGILAYRRVFLTSGNTSAVYGAFIEEQTSLPKGVPEPFSVSRQWGGAAGDRWRVHVEMTADATADQHRIAYGLNLKCLSKLGGCRDAQQLLPTVGWGGSSLPNGD
jgi:hypothetical protein